MSQIADHSVETVCAGRTDAGVHAYGQVIHFDTHAVRSTYAWLTGANRYLPEDIRLQTMVCVRNDFHARHDAQRRYYRYFIYNAPQPSAIFRRYCYWHRYPLDCDKMMRAGNFLLGEHDFSAFRSAECQAKTPFRFIESVQIKREGAWVIVDICGNAFLHHMVRNIVGSLLPVGDGRKPVFWLKEVLESGDRKKAGVTAPAAGLFLHSVRYPEADKIPVPLVNNLKL